MIDVILDTLLDTAKLLPFLFLAYLLMEFLEHHAGGKTERLLTRSGKIGPLFGGLFGIVPQCGFSAASAGLYAGRLITTGTLLAVFLSTSDEMLPIMLSHGIFPYKLLLAKFVIGVAVGFAVDLVTHLVRRGKPVKDDVQIEDICEREHCHCGDHIALSALKHTLRIAVFLLLITFLLNTGIYLIGEDRLAGAVSNRPVLANLLAAAVGLIPNCASSVVLTELYLSDIVSVGALLSGLLVNAGVGLLVLFRNNRPVRDSFRVLALLLAAGVLAGLLIDLTPLAGILG
ncbi:MAG: arsenic efflux protein [Clostridia bacterium]|nr:arsenic efflux protein [Clostridia bacterium]